MKALIFVLMFLIMGGCSLTDPPCSSVHLDVTSTEADGALMRAAKRADREGRKDDDAVQYDCRLTIGAFEARDLITVGFSWVQWCAADGGRTLSACLDSIARLFAAKLRSTNQSTDVVSALADRIVCRELWRNVELDADDHGLQRTGADQWVPALIWAAGQMLDAAMAPATAPAMFLIRPGSGSPEQACEDLPAPPSLRCTDESGCAPSGAVGPDAGAIAFPPGSDPGGTSTGGDHL